jgi:hypothetical protein
MTRDIKAANRRTGFVLLSVALVFFVGAFAARMFGTPGVSIAVLGAAVLLFLVLAIGRNLRK